METKNLTEEIIKEWGMLKATKKKPTLWDAFISMVGDQVPSYILALRADIEVLRFVAEGRSVRTINQMTGLPSKIAREIAFSWGMLPLDQDLDFNAILVYNDGMTAKMLKFKMNDLLPMALDSSVYAKIINNIECYLDLRRVLKEEEDNE